MRLDLIAEIRKEKVRTAEQMVVDDLARHGISITHEEKKEHTIFQKTPYSFFVTCISEDKVVELGKMPKFCPTCGGKL